MFPLNSIVKVKLFFLMLIVSLATIPISQSMPVAINSEGKNSIEGSISTNVLGKCGQDYILVTPTNADIWEVNVTIISDLSTQAVHIRIYEEISEYPYNYEQQLDAPYARGTGKATLVTRLNTTKKYQIWVRDAYAKTYTGYIKETWRPYIINGDFEDPVQRDPWKIPGWEAYGHIGVGSGDYSYKQTRCVGLQQADYPSNIWQEVDIDRTSLVLSFWFRPTPEGTTIGFQVFFDEVLLMEDSYEGQDLDFDWKKVIIFLEPYIKSNNLKPGTHKIEFIVPESELPHAAILLDEIKLEKGQLVEKINSVIICDKFFRVV